MVGSEVFNDTGKCSPGKKKKIRSRNNMMQNGLIKNLLKFDTAAHTFGKKDRKRRHLSVARVFSG